MSRKSNRGNRCSNCRMKAEMCICEFLTAFDNVTPVSILMHYRENITTTNTGRVASWLLKNSSIHYRGLIDQPLNHTQILLPEMTPIYLFPTEGSQELTTEALKPYSNIQLVVADGSWRQTKKFSKREPFLQNIPHFRIPPTDSIFFLRKKVREEGVSTLEAIAAALGVIEGPEVRDHLLNVFRIMMERTLSTRGQTFENFMN